MDVFFGMNARGGMVEKTLILEYFALFKLNDVRKMSKNWQNWVAYFFVVI